MRSDLKFEVVVKSKTQDFYTKVDSFKGDGKELLYWLNSKYLSKSSFWDVVGKDFDYVAMKIDEWILKNKDGK